MSLADIPSNPKALSGVSPARLCAAIEGVEFWIALPQDRSLRCVITESALQAHFGGQAEDSSSWLAAFERHRAEIEDKARAASARRDDVLVVMTTDSNGILRVSSRRLSCDARAAGR